MGCFYIAHNYRLLYITTYILSPNIFVNSSLVITKHLTSSSAALTDAPLVLFVNKAYSPKDSPYFIFLTSLSSLIITTDPYLIMKNEVAISPYVTIISPFLNTIVNSTLDMALCCSALRKSKNLTFCINLRFSSNSCVLISSIIFRNKFRSIAQKEQSPTARTDAERGAL